MTALRLSQRRLWTLLLVPLIGCESQSRAPDLRVAAASDLQAAFPALAQGFRDRSGLTVEFVAGASGQLARQIEQGAPFDVFLSADRGFVIKLADQGVIRKSSVCPYAIGSLVLAVRHDMAIPVAGLDDLRDPRVKRIALANPDFAPYGRASRQALERSGLWEELQPKLVQAETVRQALQFVRTGNAEVGLVGRAVAGIPEVRTVPITEEAHEPLVQALGIISTSKHPDAAESFVRFLLDEAGQGILSRYGFRPPVSDRAD